MAELQAAGISYVLDEIRHVVHLREPGKPKVDLWISSGRWLNYSSEKPTKPCELFGHGVAAMLSWYRQQPLQSQTARSSQSKMQWLNRSREKRAAERLKKQQLARESYELLSNSDFNFSFYVDGYCVVSNDPEKPSVTYWPTTGSWRINGQETRLYGTPAEFLAWYSKQNAG